MLPKCCKQIFFLRYLKGDFFNRVNCSFHHRYVGNAVIFGFESSFSTVLTSEQTPLLNFGLKTENQLWHYENHLVPGIPWKEKNLKVKPVIFKGLTTKDEKI